MPFSIRPYRRSPVQCFVTYHAGPAGPRRGLEFFAERMETLGRFTAESWANVFLDRQFAEPRKHLCGCCDRALDAGPGVRPRDLGG
jgi:hypothetical protein